MKKAILTITLAFITIISFGQSKPDTTKHKTIPYQPNPNRVYEFNIKGTMNELSLIGSALSFIKPKIDSTDYKANERNAMKAYIDKTIRSLDNQFRTQYLADSLKAIKH